MAFRLFGQLSVMLFTGERRAIRPAPGRSAGAAGMGHTNGLVSGTAESVATVGEQEPGAGRNRAGGFILAGGWDIIRGWRMLAETEPFLPASVVMER